MIKAIQPYIDNEEFQPAAIAKVSKACTSICQWVRAMHKYHFVAKAVEPKRVRPGSSWRVPDSLGCGGKRSLVNQLTLCPLAAASPVRSPG